MLQKDEWGKLQRLKTVEEVGLSDHEMVRYLPTMIYGHLSFPKEWVDR